MIRPLQGILVPVLAWVSGPAREGPLPVVMVADVGGRVLGGGSRPLALAEGIPPRLEVRLAAGGRLTVIHLKTGEELRFEGPATLRFDGEGRPEGARPTGRRTVASLQGDFRLEPGAWAQASVVLRKEFLPGGPTRVEPEESLPFEPELLEAGPSIWLQPRGSAILEPRPELRWRLPDVPARLRLEAAAGAVIHEGAVQGGSFRLPKALERGETYHWRLSWTLPEGLEQSAQGEFRVLPELEARGIQDLRPGPDASFAERLVFAVLLESRGLLDEARPHWLRLAEERPGDPTLQRFTAR